MTEIVVDTTKHLSEFSQQELDTFLDNCESLSSNVAAHIACEVLRRMRIQNKKDRIDL